MKSPKSDVVVLYTRKIQQMANIYMIRVKALGWNMNCGMTRLRKQTIVWIKQVLTLGIALLLENTHR